MYVHLEVNAQKQKNMSERLINAGMAGIMKVKFCFALGHYLEEVLLRKGLRREEAGKKLDRGSRHDGPSNKSLDYLIDSFNSVHARMGFTAHIFSLLAIWLSSAL